MLGSRGTTWGRTQPRPSGSESEPCALSAGRIPLHHRLLRSQGARGRGSFLQEVMSKRKPQDKQEVAKEGRGDCCRHRQNLWKGQRESQRGCPGTFWVWREMEDARWVPGRGQVMALCTLIRESGSILRGVWSPGRFLFVFVVFFLFSHAI